MVGFLNERIAPGSPQKPLREDDILWQILRSCTSF